MALFSEMISFAVTGAILYTVSRLLSPTTIEAGLPADAEPGHPPATLRHAYWPDHVPWIEMGDKLPRVAGFDK